MNRFEWDKDSFFRIVQEAGRSEQPFTSMMTIVEEIDKMIQNAYKAGRAEKLIGGAFKGKKDA